MFYFDVRLKKSSLYLRIKCQWTIVRYHKVDDEYQNVWRDSFHLFDMRYKGFANPVRIARMMIERVINRI